MAPKKDAKAARGGVEKKAKKVKDPNAPKRPLSAYFIYASEVRDQVRTDNPGISFGQVGKKIGAMWADLTSDEKAPYEAKAKTEKERYEKEKAEYEKKTESA